jgi:GR25 family glycosyltransferase involved in LPS biosynthesis
MTLDELFNNTLVLSLEHRLDRRIKVQEEIRKLPIKYNFYFGINGHEANNDTSLLPGENGIKLSHINILTHAINQNWESVFIFEDDVVFSDNIMNTLEKNLHNINCDLFYLGGHHRGQLHHIQNEIYQTFDTYTTHAMWIKKTLFQEAIDTFNIYKNQQLDNCYAILQKKHKTFTIYPNVAWQSNDYSDIQNKFINYDWLK